MDEISALIRGDLRELASSLPHENAQRRQLSANREESFHQTLALTVLSSWTSQPLGL